MALIVGTNTYVTEAELTAYALARGQVIATAEKSLILAMDYLATLEGNWQGVRTDPSQALAWPRSGVYLYGALVPDNVVPQQVKDAQCQLAMQAEAGVDLLPSVSVGGKGSVIEETVDVITVKYAEGQNNTQPVFTAAVKLLQPLYKSVTGGMGFSVVRL